jgi:uncharacterized membrane protein YdjX (TVP38/TMEM64 family)
VDEERHAVTTEQPARWLRALASPRVRLGLLMLILAAGVAATIRLAPEGPAERRELLAAVQGAVDAAGPAAPAAYVVLYAAATVAFVPGAPLTMAGGVLFGPLWGTVLTVVGATFGAFGAFVVARRLGRAQVEALAGGRLEQVDHWLERQGFVAVLYLRLVIVVPFNLLNYLAGITGVRRRDYVVATALGIVPAAFAYAALGEGAVAALDGDLEALRSPQLIAAVALIVLLAVGGPVVHRRLRALGAVPVDERSGPNTNDADGEDTAGDPSDPPEGG